MKLGQLLVELYAYKHFRAMCIVLLFFSVTAYSCLFFVTGLQLTQTAMLERTRQKPYSVS